MRTAAVLAISAAMVGIGALIVSSCSRSQSAEAQERTVPDAPAVAVATARMEDMSHGMVLTAEFKPYQEIDVMAKVAGYVKRIDVDAGDRVKQGQLLAVLEIPEMADDQARAQSMLKRSQAEVARARDELQRAESSHAIAHLSYTRLADVAKQRAGLVAQQEIDDAESKDLVTEAQVSAARSNLSAAEQQVQVSTAELQKVKTLLDYTRVTAPFAGVITRRFADTGSMIQAGTASNTQAMPLVKLSENSLLRLILPVPESAVPTVHVGQQVEVHVPTLGRAFPGRVARFAEKVMSATRTMDTEVDVPNPSLVLIPGMYAEVNLTLDHRKNILTVPIPAVDLGSADDASGQVVVVTPENRIEMRKVQLGMQTATGVEIRSGLRGGEMVVMGNRSSLRAGEQVRPKQVDNAAEAGR
ncbi:MAG: efflux RND transporter periplasmic adaptor subunit [Acidobacteriia bacterium]|nr:efflux RND transporter periplasmic adaptor subunit [Terriglobia bacterium]